MSWLVTSARFVLIIGKGPNSSVQTKNPVSVLKVADLMELWATEIIEVWTGIFNTFVASQQQFMCDFRRLTMFGLPNYDLQTQGVLFTPVHPLSPLQKQMLTPADRNRLMNAY